jgi:group II intron reverse transcriptase/maturase
MFNCNKARNESIKVRQLQRTLYRKSKQEEEAKFYSLYDKLYRDDVLWQAWQQVKANKGVPGVDGKTIEEATDEIERGEMLETIKELLRNQSYIFSPLRRVEIPKGKLNTRSLGIAIIADRIVQTAMKIVLEPIYEATFHESSYGYRPKRHAKEASLAIRHDLYQNAWGVVEIDFKSYFSSIPHRNLMKLIKQKVTDGSMLKLIKQTLKIGVEYKGVVTSTKKGVPQGSPISPLYSNIYLNVLDQLWHRREYPKKLGASMHRYADDIILICRKSAISSLTAFNLIADVMELTLNEEKTRITKLTEGFDFIGFNFVKRKSPSTGKNFIYIFPTKRAEQRVRNSIKYITSRKAPIKPNEFIELVKPIVMGWANYYRHTNASERFRRLQRFVNIRFRRYLTHRSKGRGFGWKKYPNRKLYSMGMFYIGKVKREYSTKLVQGLR